MNLSRLYLTVLLALTVGPGAWMAAPDDQSGALVHLLQAVSVVVTAVLWMTWVHVDRRCQS